MTFTDTQLEAYHNIGAKADTLREAIYANLWNQGPGTAWQIALRMGFHHRQDIAPRLTELKLAGRIRDTNIRRYDERTNQRGIVWVAV